MSTATMAQSGAVHLSKVGTRKFNAALTEQVGKSFLLEPLLALVEARMHKAQIEMESRRHSCGTASTSPGSRMAARSFSLAFGNAPAPPVSALPALQPPPRSGAPKRVKALSRVDITPGSSGNTRPSQSGRTSIRLCAQGDILLERVDGLSTTDGAAETTEPNLIVLAHGELSGHRHTVRGHVRLVHDAARARDIPEGLYLGHLHVLGVPARLEHEQHAAIALQPGTYRVRRQRHLEPGDAARNQGLM